MTAVVEPEADSPESWSSLLTDAVAKCGRDNGRRLYLYGISSDQCIKCQARLKTGHDTCDGCHYTHQTLRKCTRCSQKKDPVMWCVECDAYFCATCHKKPHVLMLGSTTPHHCFPIDGASGKHFVDAAWSDKFTAMMEATFRLRLHDKMRAQKAAASVPAQTSGQQPLSGNGAADPAVTTATVSKPLQCPVDDSSGARAVAKVNSAAPLATPVVAALPAAAGGQTLPSSTSDSTQTQSRKRQLAASDDMRDKPDTPACAGTLGERAVAAASRSIPAPAPTPTVNGSMLANDCVQVTRGQQATAAQSDVQQARPAAKMGMDQPLTQNEIQKRQRHGQKEGEPQVSGRAPQQHQRAQHREPKQSELPQNEQQRSNGERSERWKTQQLQMDQQRRQAVTQQLDEQRRQQERQRHEQCWRDEQNSRRQAEHRWQELHKHDTLRQQGERSHGAIRHQEYLHEQRRQQLLEERLRNDQSARRPGEACSLTHESNPCVSRAQHVQLGQPVGRPGFTFMVSSSVSAPMPGASMAPSIVPAPKPSTPRFTRVSSPANVVPPAPRLGPATPSPRSYPFRSNIGGPAASAIPSVGYDNGVRQSPVPAFETIPQDHGGNRHLVVRSPSVQRQQQTGYPDAIVPHRAASGAMGGFGPSKFGEDDELRAIWVSDYNSVNVLVMQLDSEIAARAEEGHAFVHMSNNITVPEQLKQQINTLCARRDAAMKKRFESVVRVCIFSDSVRAFAEQNEHSNMWSDVPEALKASHNKCAELGANIRELEVQAQELRKGVEEAVSSGDPMLMQTVTGLGALLADCEQKIRASSEERDKQFNFMFQFSETLRTIVRAEWATAGRGSSHGTR
ncbi:unnamed protein product [Hyaloperonospora brassicae]|uniref:B box-type domain-containing protein n=1 Tax=Hyaloperonospora brassicae TaxID=162125 RepID=A0AAV0V2F6_HYABA|nr:unnamed protein product [Hyaloperonospora brassicae]